MSDRTSSWPVRIACVTIPPALALAAIVYCARNDSSTASSVAEADADVAVAQAATTMESSDSSEGDLPPGWVKPEKTPAWEEAKAIDAATAARAVEAANDIYTPPQELRFERLEQLTPEVARIVSRCRYSLAFPKLTKLSPEAAVALSEHQGGLSETGLDSDFLELTGLQDLPAEVAAALASRQSGALWVGSMRKPLPELTTEAAQELARYQGRAMWICVKELSPSAREALQAYPGKLRLDESPRK